MRSTISSTIASTFSRLMAATTSMRRAHETNPRIAAALCPMPERRAKFERPPAVDQGVHRRDPRDPNGPTPQRLAKGDLQRVPVHSPNGFIEGYRYEQTDLIGPYRGRFPHRAELALTQFAADALAQDAEHITVNYEHLGDNCSRGRAVARFGGLGNVSEETRAAHTRHQRVIKALRTFDDEQMGMTVLDVLNLVVAHLKAEQAGTQLSLSGVGRRLNPHFSDEKIAKGVALGTLQTVGVFLASVYGYE